MSKQFAVDSDRVKRELKDARSNTKHLALFGSGGTFLDLGANIGQVSIDAAPQFYRVVSIEAHPHTFDRALNRIKESGHSNISIFLGAVAAESGHDMFVSTPKFSTGATARKSARLKNPEEGYYHRVPSIGINELIEKYAPRVIKMDIEGAEYEVIEGMRIAPNLEWLSVEFHMCQSPNGWGRVQGAMKKFHEAGFEMVFPREIKMLPRGVPRERFFVCVFKRISSQQHHEVTKR